jgi:dihydroxyacetone synthase
MVSGVSTVSKQLRTLKADKGIAARVVSFPFPHLSKNQSLEYKRDTLRRQRGTTAVLIEPFSLNDWERYADAAFGMTQFSHSLPGKAAYKNFGYEAEPLVTKVAGYLDQLKADEHRRNEFVAVIDSIWVVGNTLMYIDGLESLE